MLWLDVLTDHIGHALLNMRGRGPAGPAAPPPEGEPGLPNPGEVIPDRYRYHTEVP